MIIKLTTPEAFDAVLEKLKSLIFSEEVDETFFKLHLEDLRKSIAKGEDEYYLDIEWILSSFTNKIEMKIHYHRQSDILTDVEYLKQDESCE